MPMSPPLHDLIRSKHSLAVGRRVGSGSMQSSISWHKSCRMSQPQDYAPILKDWEGMLHTEFDSADCMGAQVHTRVLQLVKRYGRPCATSALGRALGGKAPNWSLRTAPWGSRRRA